jgi:hypothetical protein
MAVASGATSGSLDGWVGQKQAAADRVRDLIANLTGGDMPTVSRVVVAANVLADLARDGS